ncbi:MAG: hypothetical protein LUD00_09080 [Prevotellaceae bacterium]|nr:hypothetical protein [Prevotellaceae bacterium]
MKNLLFIVATAAFSLCAKAQNTDAPMATLKHGDQTRVWLGVDAFINAYNAAADSADIITLSSGKFNVPSPISKSFSLYGAGCEDDVKTGTKATVLYSLNFKPEDTTDEDGNKVVAGRRVNGVHIEGIQTDRIIFSKNNGVPVENLTIAKCKVKEYVEFYVSSINNTVRQCYVPRINNNSSTLTHQNLFITNSYLGYISSANTKSTIHIDHCIVKSSINPVCLCTNSILYGSLSSGSTAKNNIFVEKEVGSGVQENNNNWTNLANAGIYAAEGENGNYAEDKTFELKYPKKYVGTDNTEIGLHGGNYPWNKIPCTPRIIESNIDTKTSADGKLKVSIKVEAQTKD